MDVPAFTNSAVCIKIDKKGSFWSDKNMHIALCDDNFQERRQIEGMLEKYASERGVDLRIAAFENALQMVKEAGAQRFTHYFLDIIMPGMSGVDAAREIRSFDSEAVIIFLTSSNEYAWQSYRVRASDYLLKPVEEQQIFELMDRFRGDVRRGEDWLCIENGSSLLRIPYEHISHLEVNQKKLYFHMSNGQVHQIPGRLIHYEEELLKRSGFVKIHRSYIVNMNRVSMLSPEGCITFSGKNLPVSRLLYKQVYEAYINHLFECAKG